MASKVAVTATLAGDSSDAVRAFDKVGNAAQQMGKTLDGADEHVGRFNRSMEGTEEVGDRAERGVRGLTDILGVAAESFGLPLGPALAFGGALTQLGGGLADLAPELARLPGLQQATAAAQAALNLVMDANPIALVVLAIAALVAIFIVAYTQSETFRDIVNGAFGAVKDTATTVFDTITGVIMGPFNWARDNWPLLLAILTGPIGLAVLAITTHFDDIKGLATGAVTWITDRFGDLVSFVTGLPGKLTSAASGLFDGAKRLATDAKDWITGKLDDVVGFVTGMPGKIRSAASGMFDGVTDALRAAINAVVDIWNRFGIPSFHVSIPIPGLPDISFDTPSIDLPNLPHFHSGGVVPGTPSQETLAVLRGGERVLTPGQQTGSVYNINVYALDGTDAGKRVVALLKQYDRANGTRIAA
jgi:phage-related protein